MCNLGDSRDRRRALALEEFALSTHNRQRHKHAGYRDVTTQHASLSLSVTVVRQSWIKLLKVHTKVNASVFSAKHPTAHPPHVHKFGSRCEPWTKVGLSNLIINSSNMIKCTGRNETHIYPMIRSPSQLTCQLVAQSLQQEVWIHQAASS